MATEYITKGEVFAKTLNLPTIYLKYDDSRCEPVYRQKDIFEMLSNLIPAADVVEVVRCKDCFAYKQNIEFAEAANLNPDEFCSLLFTEMPQDGFCSFGKRRTEDG